MPPFPGTLPLGTYQCLDAPDGGFVFMKWTSGLSKSTTSPLSASSSFPVAVSSSGSLPSSSPPVSAAVGLRARDGRFADAPAAFSGGGATFFPPLAAPFRAAVAGAFARCKAFFVFLFACPM